jgi:rhodanese-related sulfurtransferase
MRTLTRALAVSLSLAAALPALAAVPPGVVDGATAQRLVAAGAKLVDVRTQAEFDAGHLAGAVLIPYDQIAARAAELGSKETPIVLYCRTGRRTAIAAKALEGLGFTRVWDMQGMTSWPSGGR